jgi:transcriptional regulator with XRE-family HTH domain
MIAAYPADVSTGTDYQARLGLVLRTARYIRELSREDVAARCGVSEESYARWERGNVDLRGHTLALLSFALDCPADLLLDPPDNRREINLRIAAHDAGQARPSDLAP